LHEELIKRTLTETMTRTENFDEELIHHRAGPFGGCFSEHPEGESANETTDRPRFQISDHYGHD